MTINTQKEVKMDVIKLLILKTLLVLKQKVTWLKKDIYSTKVKQLRNFSWS